MRITCLLKYARKNYFKQKKIKNNLVIRTLKRVDSMKKYSIYSEFENIKLGQNTDRNLFVDIK